MNIKELPIEQTGLSVRALNALHRNGVHTVGAMMEQTEVRLSQMRNLGVKTIAEILSKNQEFEQLIIEAECKSDDYGATTADNGEMIEFLKEQGWTIDDLELLSAKAYNILRINGITEIYRIIRMSWEDLMQLPGMDSNLANKILMRCRRFSQNLRQKVPTERSEIRSVSDLFRDGRYHDDILRFILANDVATTRSGLSNRAVNQLERNGYKKLSDWVFLPPEKIRAIKNLGANSTEEILKWRENYLNRNGSRIVAFCRGDQTALMDDSAVRNLILEAYMRIGFGGLSMKEMREYLNLPEESVSDERLKRILGSLLAEGELEYVDFRCYRVYQPFSEYLEKSDVVDEREKEFLRRRLRGDTLEAIARDNDITRERIRQLIDKDVRKLKHQIEVETGQPVFDEDYYRYLFETYQFEQKDARQWFGLSAEVWNYMLMTDVNKGKQDLNTALEDKKLDAGLKLRIKNFLNRNKIFADGVWIEKRRADIEKYVVAKYCRDEVSFSEFIQIYNHFLEEQEVPFDERIYYTDAVLRTRKNHLADGDFLLWKYGEMLRYYDIPGRDFEELLEALNLNGYQNIEISTALLFREYPDVMDKYDIRDPYELHNLLKKIVPEGSYHDFRCGRTPNIRFGEFNRDEAILELLLEHAPISVNDFAELIHQEYGYQPNVILANYLSSFTEYLDYGVYNIEQKAMLAENMQKLKTALKDDFYFLDEVRDLYAELVPNADLSEINSYNLKRMGFQVLARYVLQNYDSLEAYFRDLLSREEVADISEIRSRYSGVMMFSQVLSELKRNYDIVEFEPNQIISIQKLERAGITKEDLREFCDQAYESAEEEACFNIKSMRETGFYNDLYELGFSDWFYTGILASDPRFSFGRIFSTIILKKGESEITIRSFLTERIQAHQCIDTYDLMSELTDVYGCIVSDKSKVTGALKGTEIFYDEILDRFYMNIELYYREIDEAGEYI